MSVDGITPPTNTTDKWVQLRVRKYYRDYLRALGAAIPKVEFGELEPRNMNQTLEYLLEFAGARLEHQDMGASFTHTATPFCSCGPDWPGDIQ